MSVGGILPYCLDAVAKFPPLCNADIPVGEFVAAEVTKRTVLAFGPAPGFSARTTQRILDSFGLKCPKSELRLDLRFGNDHELDAIDQFPMTPFEAGDNSSRRRLQEFFQASLTTAVRSAVAFIGVEGDAVDVIPIFNRDAGDEFARLERKRVTANIAVPASAADFRKRTMIRFQQDAVNILPMPDGDARNASGIIGEDTIGHAAGAAAFLTIFFCRRGVRIGIVRTLLVLPRQVLCWHDAIVTPDIVAVKQFPPRQILGRLSILSRAPLNSMGHQTSLR
jgi:hypothetical protein